MSGVLFYTPPDGESAAASWGANCGPFAIAAVTAHSLAGVRQALANFRGHMNPTEVRAACAFLGFETAKRAEPKGSGVAHLFFDGPWTKGGARARYARSHWIAYR